MHLFPEELAVKNLQNNRDDWGEEPPVSKEPDMRFVREEDWADGPEDEEIDP